MVSIDVIARKFTVMSFTSKNKYNMNSLVRLRAGIQAERNIPEKISFFLQCSKSNICRAPNAPKTSYTERLELSTEKLCPNNFLNSDKKIRARRKCYSLLENINAAIINKFNFCFCSNFYFYDTHEVYSIPYST